MKKTCKDYNKKKKNIFERNIECKSETLGFQDYIRVKLNVNIILTKIYNLLPPWMYPIWETTWIFLFVCFLCFLLVHYDQQISIRASGKLEHWKNTFVSSQFEVAKSSKSLNLDFKHTRKFLLSIQCWRYENHQNHI